MLLRLLIVLPLPALRAIPHSVTVISQGAFWGCTSLTRINLPDGLTTIGRAAFYGCTSLISLTLPPNVTTIGCQLVKACSRLTSLILPGGVTVIMGDPFDEDTSGSLDDDRIHSSHLWYFRDF